MKTHYSLLDAVRFCAAFWVVNFHYLAHVDVPNTIYWYRYGNLGVQLFFIISGFVIIQSLEDKTLGQFTRGRFIRLFPLFWILCTATYILTLIIPHTSHLSLSDYAVNMTMLPDVINGFFGHGGLIDPSYWTLTVELLFYIGIGLSCWLFSYKNLRYVLVTWLVCSMLAFAFHIDQNFYIKLLLVRHASYFVFGSTLALLVTPRKNEKKNHTKCIDWSLLVMSAVYSIYIHSRAIPAYAYPQVADAYIVTILLSSFFIIIPLLVYASSYIHNKRLITILGIIGGLTYPLYLVHQKIGNTLIEYFTNRYNIQWNTFVIYFEVFIILVAYGLYHLDKKIRQHMSLQRSKRPLL